MVWLVNFVYLQSMWIVDTLERLKLACARLVFFRRLHIFHAVLEAHGNEEKSGKESDISSFFFFFSTNKHEV